MNEDKAGEIGQCRHPRKPVIVLAGMVLLAAIVIVSLLRERIVNPQDRQVTIMGRGVVEYQPDVATITLGAQVDKADTAENALNKLNDSMTKALAAVKAAGILGEDIQTQNYFLSPNYDYTSGVSRVSGYNANQQLVVKVRNLQANAELVSRVISAASGAGVNQVSGIAFDVSNLGDLKQEARLKAIADARSKTEALIKAAGVKKLGKVEGWFENIIQSPDVSGPQPYGLGGSAEKAVSVSQPQVPTGTQEIIIEVGLNYGISK